MRLRLSLQAEAQGRRFVNKEDLSLVVSKSSLAKALGEKSGIQHGKAWQLATLAIHSHSLAASRAGVKLKHIAHHVVCLDKCPNTFRN